MKHLSSLPHPHSTSNQNAPFFSGTQKLTENGIKLIYSCIRITLISHTYEHAHTSAEMQKSISQVQS